jgi:hypothetical protein
MSILPQIPRIHTDFFSQIKIETNIDDCFCEKNLRKFV